MRLHPPALFIFAVACMLFLLLNSQGIAAQTSAILTGIVSDPGGRPIRGALVRATPEAPDGSARQQPSQTASIDDGSFELILSPAATALLVTRVSSLASSGQSRSPPVSVFSSPLRWLSSLSPPAWSSPLKQRR